jgi:hypothetical protein
MIGLLGALVLSFSVTPIEADFIQCTGIANCNGTDNNDIINGTPFTENFSGGFGNDLIFAGGGDDDPNGDQGDDIIFGGIGDDEVLGDEDNDILLAGPDTGPDAEQLAQGDEGDDTTHVMVGEILGCLSIESGEGLDLVNLIGFGPYSATLPFGQPGFGAGFIMVFDPITNGQIAITVSENDDTGAEIINGLLSPSATIVDVLPEGCQT